MRLSSCLSFFLQLEGEANCSSEGAGTLKQQFF